MINLLPSDFRENIMYARRNTKLLRWSFALLAGISGILLVVAFGYFYIDQNTKNVSKQVSLAQIQLEEQKLEETQKRVEEISNSFKLANQVLSKQILFSELLQQAGTAMPNGASLGSLSITKLSGGIDLQAVAVDYNTATQVQVNLQDPKNKIFEKVDIVGINCSSAVAQAGSYPCTGTYRALFAKQNPFAVLGISTTEPNQ
jgi:hypothetical protein